MDTSAITTPSATKGGDSIPDSVARSFGATLGDGTVRTNSPTIEAIVAWREHLATQYLDQLEEDLTWDEGSTFEVSEDVATGGDVMFHYIAAVLDQRGKTGLRKLIGIEEPPPQELDAAFAEASRRGFGGAYPHLLLGADLWLPFKRQLMVEEPDWDGHLHRYGSVFHLVDEVADVRAAIASAQPSVVHSSADEMPAQLIVAAWQVSDTILRLASIAAERHLPLWTTG